LTIKLIMNEDEIDNLDGLTYECETCHKKIKLFKLYLRELGLKCSYCKRRGINSNLTSK